MSATKETLQEMMVLYGHDVWNLAYSLTRKADLADDISQDVFLKAYQKIESLRTQTSVKSWLLRITRNTALDYKRSFFFKRVTLYGSFFDNEPAHPSAEKEAYDNILQCLAWNVVLKLPVKYREV
ncbi:MAG TPA: sigma factor, partial [Bacilli bacterium]|nr:sigma factor [Bacilli bacterium]